MGLGGSFASWLSRLGLCASFISCISRLGLCGSSILCLRRLCWSFVPYLSSCYENK